MKKKLFNIWSHFVLFIFGMSIGWNGCWYLYLIALKDVDTKSRRKMNRVSYYNQKCETES